VVEEESHSFQIASTVQKVDQTCGGAHNIGDAMAANENKCRFANVKALTTL